MTLALPLPAPTVIARAITVDPGTTLNAYAYLEAMSDGMIWARDAWYVEHSRGRLLNDLGDVTRELERLRRNSAVLPRYQAHHALTRFKKEWELLSFAYKELGRGPTKCIARPDFRDKTDCALTRAAWAWARASSLRSRSHSVICPPAAFRSRSHSRTRTCQDASMRCVSALASSRA